MEAVLRSAAGADAQRVLHLEVLVQHVQIDFELLRDAVDVDLDPIRQPRAIVGQSDMAPAVQWNCVHGFQSRAIVQPALG